jgi:hypothetical protein
MMTHDALKAEIERYLAITGISATRFGIRAANDPRFVFDLRAGREPRSPTIRRVTEFMSKPPAKQEGQAA